MITLNLYKISNTVHVHCSQLATTCQGGHVSGLKTIRNFRKLFQEKIHVV